MTTKRLLPLFLSILMLFGCEAKHLVYVHDASLGVIINTATGSGTTKISIGYDRENFALVPKDKNTGNAMTLTAVNRVYVEGMDQIEFGHAVMTGDAALAASRNPEELKKIAEAIFKKQTGANKGESNE